MSAVGTGLSVRPFKIAINNIAFDYREPIHNFVLLGPANHNIISFNIIRLPGYNGVRWQTDKRVFYEQLRSKR